MITANNSFVFSSANPAQSTSSVSENAEEKENTQRAVAPMSPPPSLSLNMQAPLIPLLTPPSPPARATASSATVSAMDLDDESSISSTISSGNDSYYSSSSLSNLSTKKKKEEAEEESIEKAKSDEKMNESTRPEITSETIVPVSASPTRPVVAETTESAVVASGESTASVAASDLQPQPSEDLKTPAEATPAVPAVVNSIVTAAPEAANTGNYMCEWNVCNRYFVSSKAVYNHVCKTHLLNNSSSDPAGLLCLWTGCDQVKRQKWSLVNHIQEKHCNETAMKTTLMYKQRGLVQVHANQNANAANNFLFNYTKDAAHFAIQRHQRLRREDFYTAEEGPITKSIRLLSALTLRNLAKNSEKAKL